MPGILIPKDSGHPVVNFKIYLRPISKAVANLGGGRGRVFGEGKTKIQKSEYLKDEKSFLGEIKNIFQFLKDYWKTEIQKSEYLEDEKSFLREIKNIFHSL